MVEAIFNSRLAIAYLDGCNFARDFWAPLWCFSVPLSRTGPYWREEVFYPRLRGISIYLVPKDQRAPRGVFAGRIRAPRAALTRFFDQNDVVSLEMTPRINGLVKIPTDISAPWLTTPRGSVTDFGDAWIDQEDAPFARIGRITVRESLAGSDVVGVIALSNLSPFGDPNAHETNRTWLLEVDHFSTQGEKLGDVIDDLEIEVNVAYQERWR